MFRPAVLTAFILAAASAAPSTAATLSPAAAGTVTGTFPSLPDTGEPDPAFFDCLSDHGPGTGLDTGVAADTGEFPVERRANAEFALASGLPGPGPLRATFSFDYGTFGGPFCLIGYRGDGTISAADFTPGDRTLIERFFIESPPEEGSLAFDVTDFVAALLAEASPFLGLQLVVDEGIDTRLDLSNLQLTIDAVPEPAALALLGLGAIGLMGLRRSARRP